MRKSKFDDLIPASCPLGTAGGPGLLDDEMKLKPIHVIGEEEATKDLKHHFIAGHPRFQGRRRFSASDAAGSISIGWYRGEQAGIRSAHLTLKESYPEAAKALLLAFNMNEDGSITLV